MTSYLDILRSAKVLIDQHEDLADLIAAGRVDELLDKGDLDGHAVWLRILAAIEELQRKPPANDNQG